MNVFTPSFMLASGVPAMLPERSRTSAISVGLVIISGAAVSASVTLSDPSQSILSVLITLFELVRPILLSPSGRCPKTIYAAELLFDTCGGLCCFLEKALEKSRQKAACGGRHPNGTQRSAADLERRSRGAGGRRLLCPRHKKTPEQSELCSGVELEAGLEPATYALRVRRSTD